MSMALTGNDFSARCYPAGVARSHLCTVSVTPRAELAFDVAGEPQQVPLAEVKVSPRIGNSARFIYLPDGSRLETKDNDTLDRLLKAHNPRHRGSRLHRIERAPLLVLLSIAGLLLFGAWSYLYGIPLAARASSPLVPDAARQMASEHTLSLMDESVLEPTELSAERQQALREQILSLFGPLSPVSFDVQFRNSDFYGPNAFALPDGTLVFTDQLVAVLSDPEILAVAAHEIGHVEGDHGMRSVLSSSALLLAITLITGDAEAVSELLLSAPALLAQLSYSRELEHEADRYAKALMQQAGLPLEEFVSALSKITLVTLEKEQAQAQQEQSQEDHEWYHYLSTHPPTKQRLRLFRD